MVLDTAGHLTSRQDLHQSLTESFTYDALDRLTLASGPAAHSTSIGHDVNDNLISRSGAPVAWTSYNLSRQFSFGAVPS